MPLKLNGSTSGYVSIDAPAVAGATSLTLPSTNGSIVVANSTGSVSVSNTLVVSGTSTHTGAATFSNTVTITGDTTVSGNFSMASSFKRNRIINGNMLIDQRNAGASSGTGSGTFAYFLDRWVASYSQTSKFTVQQNAGSVTPPSGFTNYLGVTSSSAYSVGASDTFNMQQPIEGFNVADLGFGATGAQSVTVSFWVRSSLTGTFGGAACNSNLTRSYPFTYTVSSANTWEQKTVTIAGDTSGTWVTNNGVGLRLYFNLGAGSTYSGTAGSWASANYQSATGATSVVGTSGATFYITGVQLEVGTKATPYEMQIYSDQLAQCQRYYWKTYNQGTVPGAASSTTTYRTRAYVGSYAAAVVQFPVLMRTTPTVTLYNPVTGGTNSWYNTDASTSATANMSTVMDSAAVTESSSVTTNNSYFFQLVASAEL
jgi:hypothetical protein